MFVKVVVINDVSALDRAFTYKLKSSQLKDYKIGLKVLVPFGNGNKHYQGFLLGAIHEDDVENKSRIKEVFAVVNDGLDLTKQQIELAEFMKDRYICTFNQALSVLMPKGTIYKEEIKVKVLEGEKLPPELVDLKYPMDKKNLLKIISANRYRTLVKKEILFEDIRIKRKTNEKLEKIVTVIFDKDNLNNYIAKIPKNAKKQRALLEDLAGMTVINYSELLEKYSRDSIVKLEQKGYIRIDEIQAYRVPGVIDNASAGYEFELNDEQNQSYREIAKSIDASVGDKYLIHGITGSGKTEVYMKLMEHVIELGKQGLVLVPEISLTPQIVKRFHNRFGDKVAVLHSKLSDGERFDQWRRINEGEVSIIVGARSAIFAPCKRIGLIVIDEEHENTYKSDVNPKYKTVEIAEYLSNLHDATIVLGSATPSVGAYKKTENHTYKLLELKRRFNNKPLPPIDIIDMREELVNGNKSIFSESLNKAIKEKLLRNEQVILFINRKGFSTFVACRTCGYTLKCPNCDVSMVYHKKTNHTECSYCGHKTKVPELCPECSSKYFKYFGTGTEKVEALINEAFPEARVGRLDSVTTSRKGHLEKIISDVEQQHIDILIGTQMVTKGLDFKNVTLVGVLSADITLNLPDYVSSERTFQLLTQVAGRAGRGAKDGMVVIQTYNPEHYAILAAKTHDYHKFYNDEIQLREMLDYPPFKKIGTILVAGKFENKVSSSISNVYFNMKKLFDDKFPGMIHMYEPGPAIISRLNNKYRYQIVMKYNEKNREHIKKVVEYVCVKHKASLIDENSYVSINIDTESIL